MHLPATRGPTQPCALLAGRLSHSTELNLVTPDMFHNSIIKDLKKIFLLTELCKREEKKEGGMKGEREEGG